MINFYQSLFNEYTCNRQNIEINFMNQDKKIYVGSRDIQYFTFSQRLLFLFLLS